MTTIKATMNLMALIKAGAIVEINGLRISRGKHCITIWRIAEGERAHATMFDLSKAGLEKCLEYVNLPF